MGRVSAACSENIEARFGVRFRNKSEIKVAEKEVEGFARRQVFELGGNGVEGIRFNVDVPMSGGCDFFENFEQVFGFKVGADLLLVGVPGKGAGGKGRGKSKADQGEGNCQAGGPASHIFTHEHLFIRPSNLLPYSKFDTV